MAKLSVAAGLKRALPMLRGAHFLFSCWTQKGAYMGRMIYPLRACERTACSGLSCRIEKDTHSRLCSLIRNTPQASAPHFLRGALFHLQNDPEPGRQRAHPPNLCILLSPLSVWLRCQLHPMKVLFARCYPITSSCTPSLWPGLP